jgi:hypothetical protein
MIIIETNKVPNKPMKGKANNLKMAGSCGTTQVVNCRLLIADESLIAEQYVWEVDNGQTGTRVPLRRLRLFSPAYNH